MLQVKNRPIIWLTIAIVAVIFGPVLIKQALPEERRAFTGTKLVETTFTEIEFTNARQDIELAGMLFVPPGDGPFTAAVIIHGSGTSIRNNGWYLTLTQTLVDRGIVVLLPDKRGSVDSGGDWRTSSFEDLATDTLAAVEYLTALEDLNINRIGLIGMSQGGWIAPLAASQADAVDFVVSFSGATVTPPDQLYFEEVHNLRQMGFLRGVADALAYLSTSWLKNVSQSEFWDEIRNYDPLPHWQTLAVDGLLVFGADDTNVPVRASAARIRALNKPQLSVEIFEGSGHALEDPPGRGTSIVRDDAAGLIAEFVNE